MNIVLLNQAWLLGELQELGHKVITAGWLENYFNVTIPWGIEASDFLGRIRKHFEPDVIVYFDNSSLPSISNIEDVNIPKVFVSVDTFHHLNWHAEYAKLFNLTLVAQKDYVEKLRESAVEQINVEWFPLWVNQYYEPFQEKTIDVSFRGNLSEVLHPERLAFFKEVARHIPVDYAEGSFQDVYARSKIVLNQAVKSDVNFRVFEVLMGGAMLMTPRTGNGLDELLTDGQSCVQYAINDPEDAVDKIRFYLANDAERERIAKNGREIVLKNHSSQTVAIKLEEKISAILNQGSLKSANASFAIQSFMARSLWQLLRKEGDEKFIQPLENSLDTLMTTLSRSKDMFSLDANFETTVVVSDLICSDVLDGNSYKSWQNKLVNNFPELEYIKLLENAYSESEDASIAMEYLRDIRYKIVQSILQVN